MQRHRVDTVGQILPQPLGDLPAVEYASDALVNLSLVDTIPAGATNASVDALNYIIPSSSIGFAAGYVDLGTVTLPEQWTMEGWFYLTTNDSPLWSIGSGFSIRYDKPSNRLILTRQLSSGIDETRALPVNLALNQWYFLSLSRDYAQLDLYVDLELTETLTDFFYPIAAGTSYLGKIGSDTFTGNINSFKISGQVFSQELLYRSQNLDALKQVLAPLDTASEASEYKLLQLDSYERVNHSPTVPDTLYYSHSDQRWTIPPSGLSLEPDSHIQVPRYYTLEFFFQVPEPESDVILCSNWYLAGLRYYFFRYVETSGNIEFTYYRKSDNSVQTITIGPYIAEVYNSVALQVHETGFEIYLNGILEIISSDILKTPTSLRYQFNVNVEGNDNSTTYLWLQQFILTEFQKYTADYIPYRHTELQLENRKIPYLLRYHLIEERYRDKPAPRVDFAVSGAASFDINTNATYTITQARTYRSDITYSYYIEAISPDDALNLPSVVSTTTLTAGTTTKTFSIGLANSAILPYNPRIRLVVTSRWGRQELEITVNETRSLSLSGLTALGGYLNGFLTKSSTLAGQIPNLANTATATTAADRLSGTLYGTVFALLDTSDEILLPTPLTNVRTVVFVYRELETVSNRTYVGDSASYAFNGSADGDLVGPLLVSGSDYITALEDTRKIAAVKIAANNSLIVAVDETLNKVILYEKQVSGVWNSTASEISTGISETGYLQGTSISINSTGTAFALGFKNANNGEGVVQVWVKTGGLWVKDLHMSSPTPTPSQGAFGFQVALADSAARLFVTELGANTVHIFDKSTLWSNTPTESIIGTDRFGFSIDCNQAGTLLAITAADLQETYLYRFSTIWSLEDTLAFGELCDLHGSDDLIAVSQPTTQTVKIFEKSTTWDEIESISTTSPDFGYGISLDDNKNLNISSPSEDTVYRYSFSSSWATSTAFSDSASGQYGYSFSTSDESLVISNYNTLLRLVTQESGAIPQTIINVRQQGAIVPLDTPLNADNPQILTFQSSVGMTISKIGNGKQGTGLNGLFLGALFFNQLLTTGQLENIEDFLTRYLEFGKYSLL